VMVADVEPLHIISVSPGRITLISECPDGTRTAETLTPDQAREFAEDLLEAAKDAEEADEGDAVMGAVIEYFGPATWCVSVGLSPWERMNYLTDSIYEDLTCDCCNVSPYDAMRLGPPWPKKLEDLEEELDQLESRVKELTESGDERKVFLRQAASIQRGSEEHPCEGCQQTTEGSQLENGWYRCRACGYPAK